MQTRITITTIRATQTQTCKTVQTTLPPRTTPTTLPILPPPPVFPPRSTIWPQIRALFKFGCNRSIWRVCSKISPSLTTTPRRGSIRANTLTSSKNWPLFPWGSALIQPPNAPSPRMDRKLFWATGPHPHFTIKIPKRAEVKEATVPIRTTRPHKNHRKLTTTASKTVAQVAPSMLADPKKFSKIRLNRSDWLK